MARKLDNPFSHKNSGYERPLKSRLRRVRGRLALAGFTAMVLLLGAAYRQGTGLVTEGQLHSKHAFLSKDCAACHAAGPAAVHGDVMTANCMRCHRDMNAEPHGSLALTAEVTTGRARAAAPETRAGFIAWANQLPGGRVHPATAAGIGCSTCHRDHRGQDAELIGMTEAACQACHRSTFAAFDRGHPDFADLAAQQRRQIKFDHASHYGELFAKKTKERPACTVCHEAPTSAEVVTPRLKRSETICMGCHSDAVAPADLLLLTSKGDEPTGFAQVAALLTKVVKSAAPAPDMAALAKPGALAKVLGAAAPALLADGDRQIGDGDLLKRLAAGTENKADPSTFPNGRWTVANAENEDYVQLTYRTTGHRDARVVAWLAWLRGVDQTARGTLAGADRVAWTKATQALVLDLTAMTAPTVKESRCGLCHYVGVDPATGVFADFAKPPVDRHFTRTYSHFVHASQAEKQGASIDCLTCHAALAAPPAAPADHAKDPRWIALHRERLGQDWQTIGITTCQSCHNAHAVRQDCATCHQYHQSVSGR
ncbi:MAG: hypothetical protein H0X38_04350 [Planctomycetes bacterium]|nr:hypothetical protein [Planctomycetota bacterium]